MAAATSIVQAAKRNAVAARLHPREKSKGQPKASNDQSKELANLRAENERLRAGNLSALEPVPDDEMEDDMAEVDIDKVQSALAAVTAAFGKESKQAKELSAELENIRRGRRESKPLSYQLNKAERLVRQQRKAVDNAKTAAAEAEKTARIAQNAFNEATEKIAACESSLRRAEEEVHVLLRQRAVSPENMSASSRPPAPACIDALVGDLGDDPEGNEALRVIRARIAAKSQVVVDQFAATQMQGSGPPVLDRCPVEDAFNGRESARFSPF